jgi:mono/diheme cytochrome c family protein
VKLRTIDLLLIVGIVAAIGANVYIRRPATSPNFEFAPAMVRDPAFSTYQSNPNFADGSTLRPPVAGTIARGQAPFPYGASMAESVRAANELVNPFSASDAEAVKRGKVVYERYCEVCHAADGSGGGPVIERGFRKPPSLLRPFTKSMKDGQIFHLATYGRGMMPPHGPQISIDDRWKLILHVRALQSASARATADRPVPAGKVE